MIKLIIKGELPNLNDYTLVNRANKFAGADMKKNAETFISYHIKQQLKNVKVMEKVEVSFLWVEKNRRRDPDNVAFAKKFILDALVNNKIISSDGWKGIYGFTDEFKVDKENPRIEVIIKEMKGRIDNGN